MIDQTTDLNSGKTGGWTEKKEAMKRLAEALDKTTPPMLSAKHNIAPASSHPSTCKWLRKLKYLITNMRPYK